MACYCYSCCYCKTIKIVEHKDYEHPVVKCDKCRKAMLKDIEHGRNKEIGQKSNNSRI